MIRISPEEFASSKNLYVDNLRTNMKTWQVTQLGLVCMLTGFTQIEGNVTHGLDRRTESISGDRIC